MSEILAFTWETDIPSVEAARSCLRDVNQRERIEQHTSRIFRQEVRANIVCVTDQLANALARTGIPHTDYAIRTSRHNRMPLRIDLRRIY